MHLEMYILFPLSASSILSAQAFFPLSALSRLKAAEMRVTWENPWGVFCGRISFTGADVGCALLSLRLRARFLQSRELRGFRSLRSFRTYSRYEGEAHLSILIGDHCENLRSREVRPVVCTCPCESLDGPKSAQGERAFLSSNTII